MESKVDSISNDEAPLELVRQALLSLPKQDSDTSNNTSLLGILQV